MGRIKPLISVIVPVYNVEKYLRQCVDSILAQTYPNIEIILINDGSTDSSAKICDYFKNKYKNVSVIHQENKGQASARNKGIDASHGEYIGFIDSDDWIEPDMYEKLYELIYKYNADISSCLSNNISPFKEIKDVQINNEVKIFKSLDIITALFTQVELRFEVWNKLWKRDFIGECRFTEGQLCEEVKFDRLLFMKANKIVHVNSIYHHYRIDRPGNTLSSFKISKMCIFNEFEEWLNDIEKMDNWQNASLVLKTIYLRFCYSFYIEASKNKQKKDILDNLYELYCKYYIDVINGGLLPNKDVFKFRLFFHSPHLLSLIRNWLK
ncbi:glycosyltransferase family 2 protein [Selenomonas ruminantium]|uniref:glycosyltransferase family 2 protein n=1 Tax=Selenomonas ruminantium TaxID=971 RepID=UPI0003F4C6C9|nr:glycosyltransferase [Selenomonas ruminantium]